MPWYGWLIAGIAGWLGFIWLLVSVLALTVVNKTRKEIRKGW
jgi:hypothetical protein